MELERQNPHWEKDHLYPYEFKRFIFEEIEKSFDTSLITALYGLRRVGKTVIMKQLINNSIKQGVERANIFYFSFEEQEEDFWDIIKEYEKRIGKRLSQRNYLFFDEVQRVPEWRAKIKRLYDTSFAKIVIGGSNSLILRKGSESLAGRINEFFVPELSFREFLQFKNKEHLYSSNLDEMLENEFWDFIKKPFPELVLNPNLDAKNYVETISRKVIYEDLPMIFPVDEPHLLYKIFVILCKNPGMLVEYAALGSDLGRSRKTISAYLEYLRYGFLVRELFNYSKNQLTSEKKLKKFYPSLACFANASIPKIVETIVAQILKTKYFWNMKNRYETDFVCPEPLYAYEVKYKEGLIKEDLRGLEQFRVRFNAARTLLVSKKKEGKSVPYYRLENFLTKNKLLQKIRIEDVLF
ncbi:MAG: ATP-binding protein [Candidatus Micrarchaeota archaeon]